MAKQTARIDVTCAKDHCDRQATIGVYRWFGSETDIRDLNYPAGAYCGRHKPRMQKNWNLRLVKIDLSI